MNVDYEAVYWMLWMAAAGACAGSFLNVLIYRLPRMISLTDPRHSFCPHCDAQIRWRDNLPLLSYLILRGRCRHCRTAIPSGYPLIEGITALVFLMLIDAFYVGGIRENLHATNVFGVTSQVAASWPFLVAHVILALGLIAVAAVDLEEYYVDVRITWTVVFLGLLCQTIGTLPDAPTYTLSPRAAAMTLAAVLGLCLSWGARRLWFGTRRGSAVDRLTEDAPEVHADAELPRATRDDDTDQEWIPEHLDSASPSDPEQPATNASPLAGLLVAASALTLILTWACVVGFRSTGATGIAAPPARLALGFAALFLALIAASARSRPADALIVEAIESEKHEARGTALRELVFVAPALILGFLVWWWTRDQSPSAILGALDRLLDWPANTPWRPVQNLLWATASILLAAGMGWAVRIVFTLLLGKEALGFGDIHIMAAAGAVVGGVLVIVGFFSAALLAVLGMVLLLAFKRSRAIPFGPWLALGILAMVLLHDPVLDYLGPAFRGFAELLTSRSR